MTKHRILKDYSNIADIHAGRLKGSLDEIAHWMPLTPAALSKLPLNQVAFLDMLTMRFGKLQDIIGAKIFAIILDLLGEEAPAFIDKLNKLEKLGYLEDANWWMDLREIRNQVMHDYPDDYDLICAHLSMLVIKSDELLKFWQNLNKKIKQFPTTN